MASPNTRYLVLRLGEEGDRAGRMPCRALDDMTAPGKGRRLEFGVLKSWVQISILLTQ